MPNRAALLAAAALVAFATCAVANPLDPRHWRHRAHAPPLPYPYAVRPQAPGALPRLHLKRRHGSPVTPYPGALYPTNPAPSSGQFTMTVEREGGGDAAAGAPRKAPQGEASQGAADKSAINMPREIARRIGECWTPANPPPGQTYEVTLRVSFNAAGGVIGAPRIAYVKAGPRRQDQDDLRASILDAIQACAPLRFTPALASAIAGRLFAIRFIARYRPPSNSPSL
jgi:hypothetical protein